MLNCKHRRLLGGWTAKGLTVVLLMFALLPGCRRTDVRDYTISIPALNEQNKAKVVEALAKYGGIQKDSYVFNFDRKTLTLKYDSMQIAKTNIRMAIQEKGLEVR